MAISYEPLWETLQRSDNMSMTEMRKRTGIATATMAKLKKNESLTLAMIDKICCGLGCNIEEVVKIIPEPTKPVNKEKDMKEFKITNAAIENLIRTYANHKLACEELEKKLVNMLFAKYDDLAYAHHAAYCHASEEWMSAIGISPNSNFVNNIIEEERINR